MSEAEKTIITDEELTGIENKLSNDLKEKLENKSLKEDIRKELGLESNAVITPEHLNSYGNKFYESENKEEQKLVVVCYKLAADKGNDGAMYNYACMLDDGDGIPVDKKEAAKYYKMAIEKGNADAMYNYGLMLKNGDGIPVDKKEAAKYYKMAAENYTKENDKKDALKGLVNILTDKDFKIEYKELKEYYDFVLKKENEGLFDGDKSGYKDKIGQIQQKSKELEKEIEKTDTTDSDDTKKEADKKKEEPTPEAVPEPEKEDNKEDLIELKGLEFTDEEITEIKEAASNLNSESESNKINITNDGKISPEDLKKICNKLYESDKNLAAKCYKAAADKGNVKSMCEYAFMLEYGYDDVKSNPTKAAEYYKMAADKGGDPIATFKYAKMLYNGDGISINKEEAKEYFKKCDGDKLYSFANELYEKNNKAEAAEYYKLAADKGDINVKFKYAKMLYKSDGITENKEEAKKYFKEILNLLNLINANKIYNFANELYEIGNKEQAAEYYKSIPRYTDAMLKYVKMLYKGDGIPEDKEKAGEYFGRILEKYNNHEIKDSAIYKFAEDLYKDNNKEWTSKFYKAVADKGRDVNIMFKYANMLYNGDGITENKGEAKEYFGKILENYTNNSDINGTKVVNFADELCKIGNKEQAAEYYKALLEKDYVANDVTNKLIGILCDKEAIKDLGKNKLKEYYDFLNKKKEDLPEIADFDKKMEKIKGNLDNFDKPTASADSAKKPESADVTGVGEDKNKDEEKKSDSESKSDGKEDLIYLDEKNFTDDEIRKIRGLETNANISDDDRKISPSDLNNCGNRLFFHTENNKKLGVKCYKTAADNGNVGAMFNYATMLKDGYSDVKPNKEEAARYYKMAADNGNAHTTFKYADMLYEGDGIDKNKDKATEYYKMAANKGDADIILKYADMLYKGDRIKENKKEAVKYYKMAADNGNIDAKFKYAEMLYGGDGIDKNEVKAKEYFGEVLKNYKNNTSPFVNGKIFDFANELYKIENKEQAALYYETAAEKGYIEAKFKYANMLYEGDGITMDKTKAIEYYKEIAENKIRHIDAMLAYADILYKGDGITANKEEAAKYYKEVLCRTTEEYEKREIVLKKLVNILNDEEFKPKEKKTLKEYYKFVLEENEKEYAKSLDGDFKKEIDKIQQKSKELEEEKKSTSIKSTATTETGEKIEDKDVDKPTITIQPDSKPESKETPVSVTNKKEDIPEIKHGTGSGHSTETETKEENKDETKEKPDEEEEEEPNKTENKEPENTSKITKNKEETDKNKNKKHNKKNKKTKQPQTLKQTIATISQGKEKQKKDKKTLEDIRDEINKRIRTGVKGNDDGKIRTKAEIDKEKAETLAKKYKNKVEAYETKEKDLKKVKKALKNQQKGTVNSPLADEYLKTLNNSNEVVSDATISTIVNSATNNGEDLLTKNGAIRIATLSTVENYEKAGFGGVAYSCPPSTDINIKFDEDGFLVGCLDENMKKLFDEPLTINMDGVSGENKIKLNNTLLLFKTNPAIAFASLSKINGMKMTMNDKDINIDDGVGKQLMEAYSVAAKTRKQIDKLEYLRNSDEIKNLNGDKKEMISMLIDTTIDGLGNIGAIREEMLKDNVAVNNINDVAKIVKGIVENINDTKENGLMSKIMEQYNTYKDIIKENKMVLFKVVVNTALLQQFEGANKRLEEAINKTKETTSIVNVQFIS